MFFRMKLYPLLLLFVTLFSSCSKYTLSGGESSSDEEEKVNVYLNFRKNMSGDLFDIEYPVRIFCVDKVSSTLTEFYFGEGEGILAQVDKGEYSINAFIGINNDDFTLMNDINGKPMVAMNESGVSVTPVLSAHSTLNIEKQTEINFIPEYIVSSTEFEFSNIPSGVKSLSVEISPVCCGYYVEGGFSDRKQNAIIECFENNGKWISDQKYIFPSEGEKTTITISIDYGDKVNNHSYIISEGLELGKPYKITGGYDDKFIINGYFQIGGWLPEEDIVVDFNQGSSDSDNDEPYDDENVDEEDILYVDDIPSSNSIWESFYVWKVEETGAGEAQATIISPDQWFQIYAEGEAMEILDGYEIDGISGWRTFTREEAEEFYKEFSAELAGLNTLLERNGQNIFYTDDSRRYLCEDGEYTFGLYGKLNFYKAGKTVKYYLRPVKKVFFQTYTH